MSDDQKSESDGGEGKRSFRIGRHVFPAHKIDPGLYPVATPIGNLGDISLRALETLAGADILACEDSRVTRILLQRYGIAARPFVYHEHNAEVAGEKLIAALDEGKSVAFVSDAGTPLVSDPGFRLVNAAIEAGHRVVPIPGASAPLAALAASGLPTDSFFFGGFLPAKQKARCERLAELKRVPGTLIFFESPHRIADALVDAAATLGGARAAVIGRELTKAFEELRRGTLDELADQYASAGAVKGEIVLLIEPFAEENAEISDVDALLDELLQTMKPAKAATEAARLTGLPRKELYQRLLATKSDDR